MGRGFSKSPGNDNGHSQRSSKGGVGWVEKQVGGSRGEGETSSLGLSLGNESTES